MTSDKLYYQLRYIDKVTDYKKVFETSKKYLEEPLSEKEARETYQKNGGINRYFCDVLKVNMDQLKEIQEKYKEYHKIYSMYYSVEREEIFQNPEQILSWYHKQGDKCGYCDITQEELHQIVEIRGDNLTINKKQKRSKGSLEIEKRDPRKGYTFDDDNIILACPFCNNAKSNLIDDVDWIDIFVPAMREYKKKLLSRYKKIRSENE